MPVGRGAAVCGVAFFVAFFVAFVGAAFFVAFFVAFVGAAFFVATRVVAAFAPVVWLAVLPDRCERI